MTVAEVMERPTRIARKMHERGVRPAEIRFDVGRDAWEALGDRTVRLVTTGRGCTACVFTPSDELRPEQVMPVDYLDEQFEATPLTGWLA